MVRLKLRLETDEKIIFDYYPNGRCEYGSFEIDKRSGEITIIHVCDGDKYMRYLHHAVSRVSQYFSDGKYRNEDTIAWY